MKRITFVFIFLAAPLIVSVVLADIAPFPRPQPPTGPTLEMTTAKVVVTLKPATASQPDGKNAAGQPTSAPDFVQADVVSEFELHCTKAKFGGESLSIAFPIYSTVDPAPKVLKFVVEKDGKVITDTEEIKNWAPIRRSLAYNGYRWDTKAVRFTKQKIKVNYSLLLPVENGIARFRYVLRSGATWDKPIGQETVTVKFERVYPRQHVFFPGADGLTAQKQADGSLVWKLVNALPTEDIVLSVKLSPEPEMRPAAPAAPR